MIAVPMLLFLVLNIGSVFYALYISLWQWNVRSGPVKFLGLANYLNALADPIFQRAVQNTLYYAVDLGAADDGDRAVPGGHRQPEDPRPDVLPRRVLLPGDRQLGGDHGPVDLHRLAGRAVQQRPRRRSGSTRCSTLLGYGPNKNWIGDQDTALNSVIILNAWTTSGDVHALLPGLAAIDQRAGLRGGRHRWRERLADVHARSPSRCSARATTSWRPWRSSGRSSCSTRRPSPADRTVTRTTP